MSVRQLAIASSEPSTSRLPEEDSSNMDSDYDNEVSQVDIDSLISTSIRSSTSAKKRLCVFPMVHNFEKGIFFCLLYVVLSDINMGRGGARDIRKRNYTNTQKKIVWV